MTIETLNIDGQELKVADLPAEVQRLVRVYESTHTKRVEVENEHIQLSAALRQLSSDISSGVRSALESAQESTTEEPSTNSVSE